MKGEVRGADYTRGVVRVGVDLAKQVIQVHAVDRAGPRADGPSARARQVHGLVRPAARWLCRGHGVLLQCASLGAQAGALGLEPRIIAAQLVSPYRKQGASGKNDANDAAAICEAAATADALRAGQVAEQQSMLCVHRLREGYKEERTACINRIRGLLAEFGLVFAQEPRCSAAVDRSAGGCEQRDDALARLALQRAQLQWLELDCHMAWCDERIAAHARERRREHAATLLGIGPITASAVVASVATSGSSGVARSSAPGSG